MTESSTRRDLLRLLTDQVAAGQRAAASSVRAPRRPLAAPTSVTATADDLRALAAVAGLGDRFETVAKVARRSVRLEVVDGAGRSSRRRRPPAHARAALRVPGRALGELPAPARNLDLALDTSDGRLAPRVEPGPRRAEAPRCWGPAASRGLALRLSREVVLPRAWSAVMDPFALDAAEQEAWQDLRRRLAERQGVVVGDELDRRAVLHRFGGYPDDRQGDMPLECELLAHGLELDGRPPRMHPRAGAIEAEGGWRRWRLLAQLSADDRLGWSWGGADQRLHVWIDAADLRVGRFDRLRAVVR